MVARSRPGDFTRRSSASTRRNELIKGKRGITADAALDLAKALGTSPKMWMNFQATWDLAQAERRRRKVA